MATQMSTQEQQLCYFLKALPRNHKNRYTTAAENELLQSLFWSLAGGQADYLRLFFPDNTRPSANAPWKLRKAQGGTDGDEFTEAARGKACGHIFRSGEATYRCKTCSSDDTCVLCSRCYTSSDHTGHAINVNVSMGNSGCCDCGDPEAWKIPVNCTIHTEHSKSGKGKGKGKDTSLPEELVDSIRMTIGRVFDYICDVISCSPEQLRIPKSRETILLDEKNSRLTARYYDGDVVEDPCEFAVLLWNDEKHTVTDVQEQVAKACKVSHAEGLRRAHETDAVGRSIVKYGFDVDALVKVSKIIEQIKLTVTIRSARDTFREQMCGTLIEWLSDIAGCSVGSDHDILRQTVCEEMLKPWSTGSEASNRDIAMHGIDDHSRDELEYQRTTIIHQNAQFMRAAIQAAARASDDDTDGEEDNDLEIDADDAESMSTDGDETELTFQAAIVPGALLAGTDNEGDVDMDLEEDAAMEVQEATMAGYPPPPPPPPAPRRQIRDRDLTPSDSDTAEMQPLISNNLYSKANLEIPKTPRSSIPEKTPPKPARYWLEAPAAYKDEATVHAYEDLRQRLRLDLLILFDLRMWKKVRIDLRDLYISTVVSVPNFKRIIGLRFAGLYTTLAQLYLIADREPDHSIINISLQMLTTPSITAEVVERGNFLTNLMAILYTFLTTRQVGHPHEIFPNAVLAFDSGSVTNRRMYHFFQDLKYLFGSEHVQERLRTEERYIMQFLDLVRLHQGICPNTRAVGEHVEYETDAWISASLITREVNRLCRQFSEAFRWNSGDDTTYLSKAIRLSARSVILNSLGCERKRLVQAEVKDEVKFKKVGDYEFDTTESSNNVLQHLVVKFSVESQPISFHHALHYTLSWLIECGRMMSREELVHLLTFTTSDLLQKPRPMGQRTMPSQEYSPEDHLMAAFDYPLRVCAWLAQLKANMWVRNGMSLRHQHITYRGVGQRDVSHHRDIFLLQTAMVVCSPARVLVSIIDRFGLEHWMKGIYEHKPDGVDDSQILDVAEDLIHLLILLISDRTSLVAADETKSHLLAMRRDIIHVLCFKPLSFTEITQKLPDKFHDQEECQQMLEDMTIYKAPEGLSDVGTFELKEQYLEEIDPYIAHYNKNQREESENVYKASKAKKTGRSPAEIVFESKLLPIESSAFSELSAFTSSGIFAQIIYYALLYPLKSQELTPTVPTTRVEAFLQVVLHLVLIAISEDKTDEDEMSEESLQSFVYIALTATARSNFLPNAPASRTIASLLEMLSRKEAFKSCHAKITLVLKRMKQKRPTNFEVAFTRLGVPVDRISTASPANNAKDELEKKKQAALARQKRVMEQFQQQQQSFIDSQGDIDWGEDEMTDESLEDEKDQKKYIQHPSGTCILCQEDTKDGRLYGTFALMTNSKVLRQTDFKDPDFVREVENSPLNLDRSAESIRPFGVSRENREQIRKVTFSGEEIISERQFIGKGFPARATRPGAVSVGCGHIMHYKCFELYCEATTRRHQHQIARHHPEQLEFNEFVCPLCKALGNAFLPVIWAPKEEVWPGSVKPAIDFASWIKQVESTKTTPVPPRIDVKIPGTNSKDIEVFMESNKSVVSTMTSKLSELLVDSWEALSPGSIANITPRAPVAGGNVIWGDGIAPMLPRPPRSAGSDNDTAPAISPMKELVNVYRRLRDTMAKNGLPSRFSNEGLGDEASNDLCGSDTLAETLGYSISAVEIQNRGIATPTGALVVETIPQQAIAHLRVLAETAISYVSLGGLKGSGDNRLAKEFSADYQTQYCQLYHGLFPSSKDTFAKYPIHEVPSFSILLGQDIFIFLTKCSMCLALVENIDIMHLIRLCYIAEVLKVLLQVRAYADPSSWEQFLGDKTETQDGFSSLCSWIFGMKYTGRQRPESSARIVSLREFTQKYALSYLRKVMVLLHVRYGVGFQNYLSTDPSDTELERLTEVLHLPSFDELCATVSLPESPEYSSTVREMASAWVMDIVRKDGLDVISVAHPTIPELVGLPKNYDTLIEETMKRRCPTSGKDVAEPMLCLFCGEIFCSQAVCCAKEAPAQPGRPVTKIGGAQQHLRKCQRNIGLFISIRKCCIYYVYKRSGSWMVAPYIDRYGEADVGLRHSRQLFLNQKRYDALVRTVWLSHGVPSVISRKLEMDINNGGWETI